MSGTRVVANLLREPGFSAADGWRAKLWQKHVALPKQKGGVENKLYKRPYIVNERTGDVVACQSNAWMDAVGIIMMTELVIGPI